MRHPWGTPACHRQQLCAHLCPAPLHHCQSMLRCTTYSCVSNFDAVGSTGAPTRLQAAHRPSWVHSQASRSPSPVQTSYTFVDACRHTIPVPWEAYRAVVLWDVENIRPFAPICTTPVQLARLKALLPGCVHWSVTTALNQRSWSRARASGLLPILKACQVNVLSVPNFSDAADQALIAAGYQAVQQQATSLDTDLPLQDCSWAQEGAGQQLPLVMIVISQDTRFAQLLGYASDRCVYTVAVAPFQQGLRAATAAVATPAMRVCNHTLAHASCVAVIWEALPHSDLIAEEQQLIHCVQKQAQGLHDSDQEASQPHVYDKLAKQHTTGVDHMASELQQNEALPTIMSLLNGFRASQALFSAAELNVFDVLANGEPLSLTALHEQCQTQCGRVVSQDGLHRLLDACVSMGLLAKQSQDMYTCPASVSKYLASSSPESIIGYVHHSARVVWPLFGGLTNAVVKGGNVWQEQLGFQGSEIFSHIYKDEASVLRFMMGMHSFAHLSAPHVVKAFDLSQYRRVVDLGGATGALMYALVDAYPESHAWVVDLPHVTSMAQLHFTSPPYVKSQQLLERVHWSAVDFFSHADQLPAADLFVLSRILHDWQEDKCKQLLSTVFNLLPSGGGVLIAEMLLDEDHSGPAPALLQSLNMLVQTNGRERSPSEFAALLEGVGFSNVRACRTGAYLDAVLATKP